MPPMGMWTPSGLNHARLASARACQSATVQSLSGVHPAPIMSLFWGTHSQYGQ